MVIFVLLLTESAVTWDASPTALVPFRLLQGADSDSFVLTLLLPTAAFRQPQLAIHAIMTH